MIDGNSSKLERVAIHAATFLISRDYSLMKKSNESIESYMVSIMNYINEITNSISDTVLLNAKIIPELYLSELEDIITKMEMSYAGNDSVDNIVLSMSPISDIEQEITEELGLDMGKLSTKTILNKIIEFDNEKALYAENTSNSLFSTYITDLENIMNSFSQKNLKATTLLEDANELRLGSELAMLYFRKELNSNTQLIDNMLNIGIEHIRIKLKDYAIKVKGGEFKSEYQSSNNLQLRSYNCGEIK